MNIRSHAISFTTCTCLLALAACQSPLATGAAHNAGGAYVYDQAPRDSWWRPQNAGSSLLTAGGSAAAQPMPGSYPAPRSGIEAVPPDALQPYQPYSNPTGYGPQQAYYQPAPTSNTNVPNGY